MVSGLRKVKVWRGECEAGTGSEEGGHNISCRRAVTIPLKCVDVGISISSMKPKSWRLVVFD